ESGYIGKVGEDYNVDKNNPLTGYWNNKGSIKISTSEKETKMSFDFNRDSKNEVKDSTDFAKFSNLKGDSYSVFKHPSGKDKENIIYELKPGELTFDPEGKLTKISDMYKDKRKDSWGGFFGKDTSVSYNERDFDSAKGSKIMVDLERKIIKSEVNRIEEGITADAKNAIKKIQAEIEKFKKNIDDSAKEISTAQMVLSTAEKTKTNVIIDAAKLKIRTDIAKGLGLDPNGQLTKYLSTSSGLSTAKSVLKYANKMIGAAGDISANIIDQIDSSTSSLNMPILSSLNPSSDSRMNIQLSNPVARNLKNIEMYGGSLEIADSYGNLAPIVKTATSYGYILPSKLNNQNVKSDTSGTLFPNV
ncbi:MAG: hypothetical protein AABY22_29395, partial [Nanoarchaeota archaeon]